MKYNFTVKQMDVSALTDKVLSSENYSYIIINDETARYLASGLKYSSKSLYGSFYGVPIAICNYLDFGEVELV